MPSDGTWCRRCSSTCFGKVWLAQASLAALVVAPALARRREALLPAAALVGSPPSLAGTRKRQRQAGIRGRVESDARRRGGGLDRWAGVLVLGLVLARDDPAAAGGRCSAAFSNLAIGAVAVPLVAGVGQWGDEQVPGPWRALWDRT